MKELVTEEDVRLIRVIYLALGLGTTLFAGVVALLSIRSLQSGVVPNGAQMQVVQTLLLALTVFALVVYPVAGFLFKKVLQGQGAPLSPSAKIRSAYVVRAALYEGIAFFGLTVCLLAGLYGVLNSQPGYLAASAPYFILLGLISKTFPSKESLTEHISGVSPTY